MQPTPRTWESLMSSWYNRERLRTSLSAATARLQRQLEQERLLRSNSFLPPPNEHRFTDSLEHLFRLRSSLGQPGHTLDYPALQPWPQEHQRPVISWSVPDPPRVELRSRADSAAPAASGGSGRSVWWRSAMASWAWLALVLLVCLALHVYRKRHAKKVRRTRSEEWPTPNVLATNPISSHNIDVAISPRVDTSFNTISSDNMSNDMPPPYSECASTESDITHFGTNKFLMINEEPPPPYSSCYVAYSNPKDDLPSVHFYNSQRQSLFDNGTLDNHIRIGLENVTTNMNRNEDVLDNAEGCDANNEMNSREMVIENGRIVDINDGVANTNNNTDVITSDEHTVRNDAPDSDSIATPQHRNILV